MKTKSRVVSILNASNLDSSVTGLRSFSLSELALASDLEFQLPTNLRLGHLAEKVVSELIKASTNFKVLHENIQIVENEQTIGELDFITENRETQEILHVELAYKLYLFDPTISTEQLRNWIGPNRNDSLQKKLEKLKHKQFPLLYHASTRGTLSDIEIDEVSQALCLLVSLFIPYGYKANFSPAYSAAIKGYYLNLETFISLNNSEKAYYIPSKTEWGMDPSENEIWTDFIGIENDIRASLAEHRSPLCWQKSNGAHSAFFIVWW